LFILLMLGEVGFESFRQFAPGEHDAPSAALTFKPDVRAETRDGPFVGAAGMLFAESQVVVEAQVGKHV